MSASQPAEEYSSLPLPSRLWIWDKNVYLDENQRPWLPTIIQRENDFRVVMQQENVSLGEPMTPSQLQPRELPLLWQLYPEQKYRDSNSNYWHIVCHKMQSGKQRLVLKKLPEED
ncbi:T-cell leukemia/lymphoma protein 1A [Echinops telfairi]|uniref:T-cell leukemia/lymphoma protein 1A n=1 Tax=Echinops telfairi TaxID=9371 RepID=A0AC55CX23_ECHTE|nr:T-cell leukemia/lymphoma protein 1A [Echinops telfairi]